MIHTNRGVSVFRLSTDVLPCLPHEPRLHLQKKIQTLLPLRVSVILCQATYSLDCIEGGWVGK